MAVRAKMKVTAKNLTHHYIAQDKAVVAAQITLAPMYEPEGQRSPENKMFGDATPSGQITMFIVNEGAHSQFEVGKYYYVDFIPVD